jgi:hypothetical protein
VKITIGFSKHLGFAPMSSAIRWYLDTPFSHTYFKVQLPGLCDASVFQANGKGIGICSYTNFKSHNLPILEFDCEISDELFYELYNDFHNKAGTSYGYVQNLGLLVADLFKLKVNPFQDGVNCSEYIAYCLEETNPQDWNSSKQDFNMVSPKTVYDYLNGKKWKIDGETK